MLGQTFSTFCCLQVYAGAVMVLLRSIIARRIKDQYKITTELLSCFSCWVILAGSHFLFAFLSTKFAAVADVERHVPSHYLLVLMFAFTSLQSWFRPFLLSSKTLQPTSRLRLLQSQSRRLSYGLQALRAAARRAQVWSSHLSRKRPQAGQGLPKHESSVVAEQKQLLLVGAADAPQQAFPSFRGSGLLPDESMGDAVSTLRSPTADSGIPTQAVRLPAPPTAASWSAGGVQISLASLNLQSSSVSRNLPSVHTAMTGSKTASLGEDVDAPQFTATDSPVNRMVGRKPGATNSASTGDAGSLSVGNYRKCSPQVAAGAGFVGWGGLPPLSGATTPSRGGVVQRQRSGSVPAPAPQAFKASGFTSISRTDSVELPEQDTTSKSVLPDSVRIALQKGPTEARVTSDGSFTPGLLDTSGATAVPDRGNQLWRDLLGMTKGRTSARPYRMLPVFVPCAPCGPHDVLAWWLWHLCGCGEARPMCGGTDLHAEVNMATFLTDPSIDGLPWARTAHACKPCMAHCFCYACPSRVSSSVYASPVPAAQGSDKGVVAVAKDSTTIDDSTIVSASSDAASSRFQQSGSTRSCAASDGTTLWGPPKAPPTYTLGCVGRSCSRSWLADPHAFAAGTVLWRGTLGISAAAPQMFCRSVCTLQSSGENDDDDDGGDDDDHKSEVAPQRSTSTGDGDSKASAALALFGSGPFSTPPLAAALGRRGFLSLIRTAQDTQSSPVINSTILEEFSSALPSAAHKVLRAALRASAAAEVEQSAAATSESSEEDGPASSVGESDSDGSSLALDQAAQAKQQYGGAVIAIVAKLLCVDLSAEVGANSRRGPTMAGHRHAGGSGSGMAKEGSSMGTLEAMKAAALAEQTEPEVDGVFGVELATVPLSMAALSRVQDANPTVLGALWSLPKLAMHPIACAILKEHCKACLCPELLDFVVAVRETKRRLLHARSHISHAYRDLMAAQVASGNPPLHPYARPAPSTALMVWLGLGGDAHGAVPSSAAGVKPRSKRAARGGKAAARAEFISGFGMFALKYSPLVQPSKRKNGRKAPTASRDKRSGTTTDSELMAMSSSGGGGSTSMYSATGVQTSTILSYSPAGNQDSMMPGSLQQEASGSALFDLESPPLHRNASGQAKHSSAADKPGDGSVSTYTSSAASLDCPSRTGAADARVVTIPGGSAGSSDSHRHGKAQRNNSMTSHSSVVSDVLQLDLYAHALMSLQQGLPDEEQAKLRFQQLHKTAVATDTNTLMLGRNGAAAAASSATESGAGTDSRSGDDLHVTLPELDVAGVVAMVNKMFSVFLNPGAPLEVNISNAMRVRLTSELHEVFDVPPALAQGQPHPRLDFACPPGPKSAVAQRKLADYIKAPDASTLGDVNAAWLDFKTATGDDSGERQLVAAIQLLQVSLNAVTRMACVFDDVALEVMKLLDENVVSSLPQSDVGKRLALVRFRQRAQRRRRRQSLLARRSSSHEGSSGGSGLFRTQPRIAKKDTRKSSSSGSGTAGSGSGSGIAPPLPPGLA